MSLTPEQLANLNWRQLGFQIHEAMTGSNPNLYDYAVLIGEAKRRCDAEMARLNPPDEPPDANPVLSNPDDEPPAPDPLINECLLPPVEKIADMTHKGSGL